MLIANFFFSFSPSFSFFSFFKSRTTYTARAPFPPPSSSLANKILLCTTFEGHAQQTCEIRAYARVYRRNKELCNICVFTYSVRVYGFSSARRSSKSPPSLALALSLSATARLRRMNTVWNRFVNEMGWRCIAVQLPLSLSLPLPPPSLLSFDRSSWWNTLELQDELEVFGEGRGEDLEKIGGKGREGGREGRKEGRVERGEGDRFWFLRSVERNVSFVWTYAVKVRCIIYARGNAFLSNLSSLFSFVYLFPPLWRDKSEKLHSRPLFFATIQLTFARILGEGRKKVNDVVRDYLASKTINFFLSSRQYILYNDSTNVT